MDLVILDEQTKESLYFSIDYSGPIKMKLFSIKKLIKMFQQSYVRFEHTANIYSSANDMISKIKNEKLLQVLKI